MFTGVTTVGLYCDCSHSRQAESSRAEISQTAISLLEHPKDASYGHITLHVPKDLHIVVSWDL